MRTFELNGTVRAAVGKKDAKQSRAAELVPCVLYGGQENVHFNVNVKELKNLVYTDAIYIVKLSIEGKVYDAIMQDLQFHPVSDAILHLDFLQVIENKPIIIKLPVKLEGFANGVKMGGKLALMNRTLKVKGLAENLPDAIAVNIEKLELGKSIKVGELNYDNFELLDSKNSVICTVKLTRAAKGTATAEAEAAAKKK